MVCCMLALTNLIVGAADVTPLGVTRDRIELAHERLCSPPLGDLDFVMSDVNFKLTRRFTEYSGDISGRMLGALNATSPLLDADPPLLRQLLQALPGCQKPDGHFGADQSLAIEVDQQRDMPILWGNGRMLLALAQRCASDPDPALLETAIRLGDYVISTRQYYGKRENFESVGGLMASGFTTCYPSLIDGLVALGEVSGEQRFLDEARFISGLSLLDKEFKGHHSHGRLTAYRGMLDLDRLAGTNEFIGAVVDGCREIRRKYLLPTGGVTEIFDLAYSRDEGCSEADWVRVNYLLWVATRDKSYLDAADSILRNHLLPAQFESGGFGHGTFKPVKAGDTSINGGRIVALGSEAYWCCSMHGAQLLADVANWGVVTSPVPFHQPETLITFLAEAEKEVNGMRVAVKRTAPASWTVSLTTSSSRHVALDLRVPGWSIEDDRPFMMLGGERVDYGEGWPTITFPLTGKAELQIEFSNKIHITPAPAADPSAAAQIFAGGELYCLPDAWLDPRLRDSEDALEVTLAADHPENSIIPVIVTGPDGVAQRSRLTSMMNKPKGGCRVVFKVRQLPADQFAELTANAEPEPPPTEPMELRFACDGEIQVSLNGENVYTHNGWHESPLAIVYPKQPQPAGPRKVEVKIKARKLQPGLIGTIKADGRIYTTRTEDWTVHPAGSDTPQPAPAADLGGFGSPPWDYFPGHFAGTSARWIGPAEPGDTKEWIFNWDLKQLPAAVD
ncbi:MAG TPA: beta-L-arabinofuranosidase domain-containing protein [Candidatus Bathyarchaeia archaeon]|nr:beta-L-arabinofuranosidase domain-containing protein [Candidatus Bathyarchaeia archaeon]